MKDWQIDKKWADRYLPEIKNVIKEVAGDIIEIQVASQERDQKEATDYIVSVSGGDIGCRVRTEEYWEKYGDITLRSFRPSGAKTEVQKIKEGFGRWYLYMWVKESGKSAAWVVFDLDTIRDVRLLDRNWPERWNWDRSSKFVCIPIHAVWKCGALVRSGVEAAFWDTVKPYRDTTF